MALSNWTMISNSSLRDVDGDDLRDELVGYADYPRDELVIGYADTVVSSNAAYHDGNDDDGDGKIITIVNEYY